MIEEYIAVDIETTGLSVKRDCILEIGAVRFYRGVSVAKFSTLVQPKGMIPERITALTGITRQMIADAPVFREILPDLDTFLGDLPLVGHHLIFDYSFLKKEFLQNGIPFEKYGVDTLALCRRFLPPAQKKNLSAACGYFGIVPETVHRALADATGAGLLLEALQQAYGEGAEASFAPQLLQAPIKKEQKIQIRQKQYLIDFAKWHKIDVPMDFDNMTRSETSRLLDQWISKYGRM